MKGGGRRSYVPPTYVPLGQLEQSDSGSEKDEDEVVVGGPIQTKTKSESSVVPHQWTSGICACCDDLQSYAHEASCENLLCKGNLIMVNSKSVNVAPVSCYYQLIAFQSKHRFVFCMWFSRPNLVYTVMSVIIVVRRSYGFIGLICPCFLFGKNAEFLGSGTFMGSCMTHFILWGLVNTLCCFLTDGVLLGLPGCFVSCYTCGYRRTLRSKYNLQEAPCGDFITHFFCHLCAICQEYREIRERSDSLNSPDLNLVEVTAPPHQTMESATLN